MLANSRSIPSGGVAAFAMALLLQACGHAEQVHPATPSPAPSAATPQSVLSSPNTATAATVSISADILRACNIPDRDAYFAFDSSKLTHFDHAPLDAVAKCFTTGPMSGRTVKLVGHADPRGGADYNMTLGLSRADAVGTYLSQQGVTSAHETTTSRGAMDATGRDETGWAHDRRVDVLLAN